MKCFATAMISLLALTGCGHLRLEVQVLDPRIVKNLAQDDRIRKELPIIVSKTDAEIDGQFNTTYNTHYAAYTKTAAEYRKQAAALPKNDSGRELLEGVAQSLDDFSEPMKRLYEEKKASLKANGKKLAQAWDEYKSSPDEFAEVQKKLDAMSKEQRETTRKDFAALSDATEKGIARNKLVIGLDERQNIESSFIRAVQLDLQDLETSAEATLAQVKPANKPLVASAEVTQNQAAETVSTIKQLFANGGLPLSPYAYYVASAPEAAWAKDYDRSKAHGYFGNTDIAIKALGEGNYTLKGVSFNPADVASAASKVGTQMVLLAAQIGGVPVRLSSGSQTSTPAPGTTATPPDGTALATSSNRMASLIDEQGVAAAQLAAQRDALLRIASAILREKDVIQNGNDKQLKAALDAIKASYESHAPRLTIPTTAEGAKP